MKPEFWHHTSSDLRLVRKTMGHLRLYKVAIRYLDGQQPSHRNLKVCIRDGWPHEH